MEMIIEKLMHIGYIRGTSNSRSASEKKKVCLKEERKVDKCDFLKYAIKGFEKSIYVFQREPKSERKKL